MISTNEKILFSVVFKFTFSEYFLFNVCCISLCRIVLWDFSFKHMELFYATWRKCIGRLLGLSYRAHNNLLHRICNYIPSKDNYIYISNTFFVNNLKRDNTCGQLCVLLCSRGSRSDASNLIPSLPFIIKILNVYHPKS